MGRRIAIAGTFTVLMHIGWVATHRTGVGDLFAALFGLGCVVTVLWPLAHRLRNR